MRDSGSPSDDTGQGQRSIEHENLGLVVQMIVRIDQLRRDHLRIDEIAGVMAEEFSEPPGGGVWDVATTSRVLATVESIRSEQVSGRAHGDPRPLPGRRAADGRFGRFSGPPLAGRSPEHRRRAATELSMAEHAASALLGNGSGDRSAAPARGASSRREEEPAAEDETASGSFGLIRIALGVAALVAVSASGYGVLKSATAGDGSKTPEISSVADPVGSPTGESPSPADTMAIRIEPATSGVDPSAGAPDGATATIRNDGRLHVEGAFQTQDQADLFLASAGEVFGNESLVESYVIDPAAPAPEVADVVLDKPVLFESGTATIDPEYIPFLEACGDILKLNPHITMSIAAFTDAIGSDEFNMGLSQERAQAIVDFYRSLQVDNSQLLGTGFGEKNPIADNETPEGRRQNRRAMLQLLNVMGEQANALSD